MEKLDSRTICSNGNCLPRIRSWPLLLMDNFGAELLLPMIVHDYLFATTHGSEEGWDKIGDSALGTSTVGLGPIYLSLPKTSTTKERWWKRYDMHMLDYQSSAFMLQFDDFGNFLNLHSWFAVPFAHGMCRMTLVMPLWLKTHFLPNRLAIDLWDRLDLRC